MHFKTIKDANILPYLLYWLTFREPSDAGHGFKSKRSLPRRQVLVGYWGQNSIGSRVSRSKWEKDLRYFCNNHKFDIYLVAFIHRLFRNNRNRGSYDSLLKRILRRNAKSNRKTIYFDEALYGENFNTVLIWTAHYFSFLSFFISLFIFTKSSFFAQLPIIKSLISL